MKRDELDRLWASDRHWKAGIIYHCEADPRVVVPKRQRWAGWTVNFGHQNAWSAIGVGIAILVGPLAMGTAFGMTSPLAQIITVLISAAALIAATIWYTNRPT